MDTPVNSREKPRLLPIAETLVHRLLERLGADLRWIDTAIGRVRVVEIEGTGTLPPVIVLHGFTSSLMPFARTMIRLARRAQRVIAIDYPGHGRSDVPPPGTTPAELLASVFTAIDVLTESEPHVLVGNSLGGFVGLRYAILKPERVRGLFLASPAGARISAEEFDALKRAFDLQSTREVRDFLRRVYFRVPRILPFFAPAVLSHLKQPFFRDFMREASLDHLPTSDEFAKLTMPVVLFWGREERLLPPSCLRYFREHLPTHAEIQEPEGFGHCPHMDDSRRFTAHVVRFLERV